MHRFLSQSRFFFLQIKTPLCTEKACAIVYDPAVLLLDEPLSNLDAKLRERMRFEILELQRKIGITTIYVTHDQEEAMVLSDEVLVMDFGKVVQRGGPEEIYFNPNNEFVADFIGKIIHIKPEDVLLIKAD